MSMITPETMPIHVFQKKISDLYDEFLIDKYTVEIDKILKPTGNTYQDVINYIRYPYAELVIGNSDEIFQKFEEIKLKYNYASYLKKGLSLRKDFYKFRSHYLDSKVKVKFNKNTKSLSSSVLEKLRYDYITQGLISEQIDKGIRQISNKNHIEITYEDYKDGSIKSKRFSYKETQLYEDGSVETFLIPRSIGKTVFDSFFLSSYYNIDTSSWEYIPIKLIIDIKSSAPSNCPLFKYKK